MLPDESLLKGHLEEASYRIGVARKYWGLHGDIVWPHAIFWCKTEIKGGEIGKIFLRFTLDGYSQTAPTACPWDIEKNQKLAAEFWPNATQYLRDIFKPSNSYLYAPCDRHGVGGGHGDWQAKHKTYWWTSASTIVVYLTFLYECLNGGVS